MRFFIPFLVRRVFLGLKSSRGFILVLTLMGTALLLITVTSFIVMAMKGADEANLYRNRIGAEWELERVALLIKAELRYKISQNAKAYENPNGSESAITVFRPENNKSTKFWKFWGGVADEESELLPNEVNRPNNNTITDVDWSKMLEKTGWAEGEVSDWRALESRLVVERARRPFKARFRFSVHEQGSKYNVNIAGLGNILPADRTSPRGSVANANLSQDATIDKTFMDAIQKFRWGEKFEVTAAEKKLALSQYGSTGFEKIPQGMNTFLDRSDYLEFCRQMAVPVRTELFTTFSKDFNGPTWAPTFNGSTFSTYKFKDLYTYKYLDECNSPYTASKRSPNRDLANARDEEGRPLLRKRFPLSRLKLLENAQGAVGKDDDIYKYFGLTRASKTAPWVYDRAGRDDKGNTRIYQIHEPAFLAEKREPDFFELLQAGILAGSLGLTTDSSDTTATHSGSHFLISLKDQPDMPTHIFRIGANLIDQSDADGWPTRIQFKARDYDNILDIRYNSPLNSRNQEAKTVTICGNEANPYLWKTFVNPFQENWNYDMFLSALLWNPYRTPNYPSDAPSLFRVALKSGECFVMMRANEVWTDGAEYPYGPAIDFSNPATQPVLAFNNSKIYSSPIYPKVQADINEGASKNIKFYEGAFNSGTMVGAKLGTVPFGVPYEANIGDTINPAAKGMIYRMNVVPQALNSKAVSLFYEYLNKNGSSSSESDWVAISECAAGGSMHTNALQTFETGASHLGVIKSFALNFTKNNFYSGKIYNIVRFYYNGLNTEMINGFYPLSGSNIEALDCRTERFGRRPGAFHLTTTQDFYRDRLTYSWADRGTYSGSCFVGMAAWSSSASMVQNVPGIVFPRVPSNESNYSPITYYDLDLIMRRGDGNITLKVFPADANREDEKPVMLNRPFKSVAEMGYAFRDLPWKSVNFFSSDSADAALLDLFCVEDDAEITSGKLDLNLINSQTLKPLLELASLDPIDEQQTLIQSSSVADAIESKVNGQFYTRSELATRLTEFYPEAIDRNKALKVRREGVVRALADSVQTRTANLMVNIVLQLGRERNGLFNVRGESHQWLHLAIDRFTNEVVYEEFEDVSEE